MLHRLTAQRRIHAALCWRGRRVMKAIILSAGQGRRLLPYTAQLPKCLVRVYGRPLLQWQLGSLHLCGVTEAVIVTGFMADAVDAFIQQMNLPGLTLRTIFNPFYAVADNLASLYLAADELRDGGVILNGDTLFEPAVLQVVLQRAQAPVSVTIDRKLRYDDDDMKVQIDGVRLCAIGKTLREHETHGESIGILRVTPDGAVMMKSAMEMVLRDRDGFRRWYLSAVDRLAKGDFGAVGTVSIEGLGWCEVDCPADMARADTLMRGIAAMPAAPKAATA